MKIYTGNFGNIKKYREAGIIAVSIARFARYFKGPSMMELAPYPHMLKMSEQEYTPMFKREMLGKITSQEVKTKLEEIGGGKDVVLLCYEKEGDFCHRHLVSEWLQSELGIEVKELGKMEGHSCCQKKTEPSSSTLF